MSVLTRVRSPCRVGVGSTCAVRRTATLRRGARPCAAAPGIEWLDPAAPSSPGCTVGHSADAPMPAGPICQRREKSAGAMPARCRRTARTTRRADESQPAANPRCSRPRHPGVTRGRLKPACGSAPIARSAKVSHDRGHCAGSLSEKAQDEQNDTPPCASARVTTRRSSLRKTFTRWGRRAPRAITRDGHRCSARKGQRLVAPASASRVRAGHDACGL